jgi:hypothetical protein
MLIKGLRDIEIKSHAQGTVTAVFSTFNVVDLDGDVTLPGAFDPGAQVVLSPWNHSAFTTGALPAGKGVIRSDLREAVMDGQFFMNSAIGRETFETVKSLAESGLGEWSYGFDILDSDAGMFQQQSVRFLKRLKVYEVSPVLRGAGIDTRTVDVKSSGLSARDWTDMAAIRSNVVAAYHPDTAMREDTSREYLRFIASKQASA